MEHDAWSWAVMSCAPFQLWLVGSAQETCDTIHYFLATRNIVMGYCIWSLLWNWSVWCPTWIKTSTGWFLRGVTIWSMALSSSCIAVETNRQTGDMTSQLDPWSTYHRHRLGLLDVFTRGVTHKRHLHMNAILRRTGATHRTNREHINNSNWG